MDVGIPGKFVNSACYDKQQVCVHLQPLQKSRVLKGVQWYASERTLQI